VADQFQLKAILSAVDKMSPVLKQMQVTAKSTRKYLADLGNSAVGLSSKIGLPITALSGLAAGFGVGAIKKAMTGFAQAGEDAYKGAIKAGMSVEEWQRLKYVFEQSGSSVDAMESAMGKLNKGIGMAAAGKNKDLLSLLQQMHIPLRKNGTLRSAADMLPELADHFNKNTNAAIRARMANALYGKQWAEIAPTLSLGSKGIEELIERMKPLKGVMGDDAVKQARAWGQSMYDLDIVTKGFQGTIAKQLVPVLTPLLKQFTDWAAKNREVIATDVKSFVSGVVLALKSFDWAAFADGVKSLGRGLKSLVDSVGGTRNALIGLVVIMNLQAVAAAASLAGSIWRAGSALLGFAMSAVAPVAPLQSLSAAMLSADVSGAKLIGTMGRVSALAGVAGAAFAGWEVGGWLNDNAINPMVRALTGDKSQTLGGWIYDTTHRSDAMSRPSPVSPAAPSRVNGEIKVTFDNAPSGMRVVQTSSPSGVNLNPDVGYRTLGGVLGSGLF